MRQNDIKVVLNSVLDTGCGAGYYVGVNNLDLETYPVSYTASMVDGTIRHITEAVDCELTVGDISRKVSLRVIPNSGEEPYILFGRYLIKLFDLTTNGTFVKQNNLVLDDDVKILNDFVETLDDLDSSVDDLERVTLPLSSLDSARAQTLVKSILNQSMELPFCPGATMELKSLESHDIRDVPEQAFFFELKLPKLELSNEKIFQNRFYSQSLYSKLNDAQRLEFDIVVQNFVDKGYWIESSKEECEKLGPYTANVFPVCVEGKAMRLVSDFRQLNVFYPSSTTCNRIYHPIMMLRCFESEGLVVGDARQAFYKIRLSSPLWLTVGLKHFLCTRLAFGLSMGVEALRLSLGQLWDIWKKDSSSGIGFGNLWVDDFLATTSDGMPLLICIFGLCGFDISQKKFQMNTPDTKFLGTVVKRNGNSVEIVCDMESKRAELLSAVDSMRKSVSKRKAFAVAGAIAYDISHSHPCLKLIADLLRKLIGKYRITWDTEVKLSREDQVVYEFLLDWLKIQLETPCNPHITHPVRLGESIPMIKLETDASMFAYAVVVWFKISENHEWEQIYADACALKPAQFKHHINRNEALGLLVGMRIVSMYLQFLNDSRLGSAVEPIKVSLEIKSDSTTALAWARTGSTGPAMNFKAIEWRQIVSIADALYSEYKSLRTFVPDLSIGHLKGSENSTADSLSRLLHQEVGNTGKLLGQFFYNNKESKTSEDDVGKIDDNEPFLETLARNCHCLEQLLYQLAVLANLGVKADAAENEEWDHFDHLIWLLAERMQRIAVTKHKQKYVLIERFGLKVLCYQQVDFNGNHIDQVVIPSDGRFSRTRELIIKYFHVKNLHRGWRYDVGALCRSVVFIEGLVTSVRLSLNKCLICARKNADNKVKAIGTPVQTVARQTNLPPFSRVCIDFIQIRGQFILSVQCIDCCVVYFSICNAQSAEEAIKGLDRMSNVYSVDVRLIHSDNAQALSKSFKRLAKEKWPYVQLTKTVPYSSHQNLVERVHRELWNLLKARKLTRAFESDEAEITTITLEEMAYILNNRPLAVNVQSEILTPAKLAWGCNFVEGGNKLHCVREYFYSEIFSLLRRRHLPNSNLRRYSASVGLKVLVQAHEAEKDEYQHRVGTIVGIEKNAITVRVEGKVKVVNSWNTIPLPEYFQVNTEDSPGGHEVN